MAWVIDISYRDRNGPGTLGVKRPFWWDVLPPTRREGWARTQLVERVVGSVTYGGWREVKR